MIYINIGSNLSSPFGDRVCNIKETIKLISKIAKIIKVSDFFESPSYPNDKLPKYLNVSLEIKFLKKPKDLLKELLKIEKKIFRRRMYKNAPRTCDIDIIDFEGMIFNSSSFKLPHPRAHLRSFVLIPLKQIAPKWRHSKLNKKIEVLIQELSLKSRNEITRLKESAIIN